MARGEPIGGRAGLGQGDHPEVVVGTADPWVLEEGRPQLVAREVVAHARRGRPGRSGCGSAGIGLASRTLANRRSAASGRSSQRYSVPSRYAASGSSASAALASSRVATACVGLPGGGLSLGQEAVALDVSRIPCRQGGQERGRGRGLAHLQEDGGQGPMRGSVLGQVPPGLLQGRPRLRKPVVEGIHRAPQEPSLEEDEAIVALGGPEVASGQARLGRRDGLVERRHAERPGRRPLRRGRARRPTGGRPGHGERAKRGILSPRRPRFYPVARRVLPKD